MVKRTILGVLAVVLFTAVFSFLFDFNSFSRQFKPDKSIKILNFTAEKQLDTVINKGMQILGIKNITVVITELSPEEMEEEVLMGYIDDYQTYFLVKLRPGLSEDYYLTILSHELWHLSQLHSGRLKKLYYGFLYDGVVYTWNSYYYERLFELDAFEQEESLKLQIISNPLP